MALSGPDIAEIDALFESADALSRMVPALKARFPGLTITCVDQSDLGVEPPYRQYKNVDLYLVDGANHCWSLTDAPDRATGLVIASKRSVS